MNIRRWHSYLGLLIAPSVLFFALTGALQLFNLHEAHGDYRPAPIIEKLSSVHKDQVFELGHHGPPPADAAGGPPQAGALPPADHHDDGDADKAELPKTLLKAYFLVVALALALSTGFGIWIGLTQIRARRLAWTLLLVGTLLPIGLLLI